jgi:tRNA (pseudouridine54-N1)-methyltransferase
MREFIYFSNKAPTSGKFDESNLMKAGRLDVALHVIINSFFISHNVRNDVKLHLIFYGMPDPPKHLELTINKDFTISKKDLVYVIKKMLYKYKEGQRVEGLPGCFIEKKNLLKLVEEMQKDGKTIYVLDKKGDDIRETKISKNPVFLLGDHEGFPLKELKRLKSITEPVSIGPEMYFASQTVAIVQNELDRLGI